MPLFEWHIGGVWLMDWNLAWQFGSRPMTRNTSHRDRSDERTRRFVELFSSHEQRVKRYILSLLPHWSDAEDAFAETNVRLWEQFDQYDPESDFGAWACTIARYQVLTIRKQIARRRHVLSVATLEALAEDMATASEQSSSRLAVLQICLGKIRLEQRQLIQQVYASQAPLKELAGSFGMTTAALKMRLSRIRRSLHKCIVQEMGQEDER